LSEMEVSNDSVIRVLNHTRVLLQTEIKENQIRGILPGQNYEAASEEILMNAQRELEEVQ